MQQSGEDRREDWAPSRSSAAQGRAAGRGLVGERLLQKEGGCGLWELQHQKLYQGRDSGTGSKTSFWNKKSHLPINIYPQVSMFVYCWEYSIVIINLLFESERLGFKSRLCTSMESWADPCFGEFQEPAHHRHWINSSYYQLVAQVSRPHIVPRVFLSMLLSMCSVSGFTAPITSQMAVSCLITFSLCPNRRAGLWLSLEGAVGGEWLFFTNSQQSPGDRETQRVKSLMALVAVPGEPTRGLPLAAPCSRCSLVM